MDVGERVTALRLRRGWSIIRLAYEAEMAWSTVANLESGRVTRPTTWTVLGVATALGVTPDQLLGLDEIADFPDEEARRFLGRDRAVRDRPEPATDPPST